jgi:hypothetical protein
MAFLSKEFFKFTKFKVKNSKQEFKRRIQWNNPTKID